jgi:hypothetical protein
MKDFRNDLVSRRCNDEYGAHSDGFLIFEVHDIIRLVKEIMAVRESMLKGKSLVTIKKTHMHAMQYLLSAVCKNPAAAHGGIAREYLEQFKGKLLTYAHDTTQRKAWEAFKEFLKRCGVSLPPVLPVPSPLIMHAYSN